MNDTPDGAWEQKLPASAVFVERDGDRVPLSELLEEFGGGTVTVAWGDIEGVPAEFPPAQHSHAWGDVTGKPATFPAASHTHAVADVGGLQDIIDGLTERLDALENPATED